MGQRESRFKTQSLRVVGGVNQRVNATELSPEAYANIDGLFPEFAGLQGRLYGKRLLQKYANPIYGIHQFWTPQGYGGGAYQFAGTVDFGAWLTPNGSINYLVPLLSVDGGNMTLDEFGYPYGSNFGYGTDNTCVISFLNGGNDHSSCNPANQGAGLVDDSNGGPAGQGRKCKYVLSPTVIAAPRSNYRWAYSTNTTTVIGGPLPAPEPLTAMAQAPSPYTVGEGAYDANAVAYYDESSSKTPLGGGTWRNAQGWTSFGKKIDINFSAGIINGEKPVLTTITFSRNGNAPFEFFDVIIPINYGEDGNYANYTLDTWNYVNRDRVATINGNNGFTRGDFVNALTVTVYHNRRVCT